LEAGVSNNPKAGDAVATTDQAGLAMTVQGVRYIQAPEAHAMQAPEALVTAGQAATVADAGPIALDFFHAASSCALSGHSIAKPVLRQLLHLEIILLRRY